MNSSAVLGEQRWWWDLHEACHLVYLITSQMFTERSENERCDSYTEVVDCQSQYEHFSTTPKPRRAPDGHDGHGRGVYRCQGRYAARADYHHVLARLGPVERVLRVSKT